MFNKLLGRVDGADTWLALSLIIFGAFFIGVIAYLIFLKKDRTDYLKNIPFNETEN